MLLQEIVEGLDAELERLQRLRAIVAGLKRSPAKLVEGTPVLRVSVDEAGDADRSQVVVVRKLKQKMPRRAAVRVPRLPKTEKTALNGTIPKGPIVVSAAQAREQAAKSKVRMVAKKAEPAHEPGTLGSMIRALRLETS